jgi:hypothetical protein
MDIRIAGPKGDQPRPQDRATVNIRMNPADVIKQRQLNGSGAKSARAGSEVVDIYSGFTSPEDLAIEPWDIVLQPRLDAAGVPIADAKRFGEQSPFGVLNGMVKPAPGSSILETHAFVGVAKTQFMFGPLQTNQQLAVVVEGMVPYVNRSLEVVRNGTPMTVCVDFEETRAHPDDATAFARRSKSYSTKNTGRILKPYFVPIREEETLVLPGISGKTVAMMRQKMVPLADTATIEERIQRKIELAGLDAICRGSAVGIAFGAPVMPDEWGYILLVNKA